MFVNFKTPKWYLAEMDKFMVMPGVRSDEFDAELKKMLVLADNIDFARIKLKQATDHRNKVKKEYGERLAKLCSKKNYSSNYSLTEFYTEVANTDFFNEIFEGKVLLKDLKEYILEKRDVIKKHLSHMHAIWKRWYQVVKRKEEYAKRKEEHALKPKQKKTGTCRLSLTREESLRMIKALTDALKKEPDKDQFIMTFNSDIQ